MASNCKESWRTPCSLGLHPSGSQEASELQPNPSKPKKPYRENIALQRAHKVYYERRREDILEQSRQCIIDNREILNERMRIYLKET